MIAIRKLAGGPTQAHLSQHDAHVVAADARDKEQAGDTQGVVFTIPLSHLEGFIRKLPRIPGASIGIGVRRTGKLRDNRRAKIEGALTA